MHGARALVLSLAVLGAACQPDLPPCDDAAAHEVVFLDAPSDVHPDDGIAMYEGQALLYQSCGAGSFCHATNAEGTMRAGVPRGYDFDSQPACIGFDCTSSDESLVRLRARIAHVRANARHLYAQVEYGSMPPGAVGERVRARAGVFRRAPSDGSTLALGELVDGLDTAAGRRAFGVWLACGAPVVQTVREPDASHVPGDPCTSTNTEVGDCVTRVTAAPATIGTCASTTTPSYQELYEKVFDPLCASSCHSGASPNSSTPRLSGNAHLTYLTLVDPTPDEPLVDPGNAAGSHVVHHLEGLFDYDVMPLGMMSRRLPTTTLASVRAWIDANAPESCQ